MAAYLDGELTGEEMFAVRNHLSQCTRCSAEFDGYRRVKQMVSSLPTCEPRIDFEQRLLSAVASAPTGTQPFAVGSRAFSGIMFFAAAALLVIGILLTRPGTNQDSSKVALASPIDSDQAYVQASAPFSTGVAVSFEHGLKR